MIHTLYSNPTVARVPETDIIRGKNVIYVVDSSNSKKIKEISGWGGWEPVGSVDVTDGFTFSKRLRFSQKYEKYFGKEKIIRDKIYHYKIIGPNVPGEFQKMYLIGKPIKEDIQRVKNLQRRMRYENKVIVDMTPIGHIKINALLLSKIFHILDTDINEWVPSQFRVEDFYLK